MTDAEMDALLDVLALDAQEDRAAAFSFRPGWWTWERPESLEDRDPTLGWARRRLAARA